MRFAELQPDVIPKCSPIYVFFVVRPVRTYRGIFSEEMRHYGALTDRRSELQSDLSNGL